MINHREAIGGMWDEIGKLQFDFLVKEGLEQNHNLLDVGCGSLRGGVHFIKYLDEDHYFCLEKENDIFFAGVEKELPQNHKSFNYNITGDFIIPKEWPKMNYALAQSVFTHLLPEQIEDCLNKLKLSMCKNGLFFSTFFPSDIINKGAKHKWRSNERDVTYYPFSMFNELAEKTGWKVDNYGTWGHPRGQNMLVWTL